MARRRDVDLGELERELVRTRWHSRCVRHGVEDLAARVAIQVTKLEQLAATEARLVAELKLRAPERLARILETPAVDDFGDALKAAIADANRREAAQRKRGAR